MKKTFICIVLSLFAIECLFLFGCTNNKGLNGVTYNTKYCIENASKVDIENNVAGYIIFKNNHKGELRTTFYYNYNTYYFVVKFSYTKVDNSSVMITYRNEDRIFDDESFNNTSTKITNNLVLVSENVVGVSYTSSIEYYFNENYLEKNGYIR